MVKLRSVGYNRVVPNPVRKTKKLSVFRIKDWKCPGLIKKKSVARNVA